MKQFGHTSDFKDGKSQRSYTDKYTCHVGVRIDGKMQEVYRIERVNAVPLDNKPARDEIHVSDMLDEGHWFQPTVERKPATRCPRTVIAFLGLKYERLARKQLGGEQVTKRQHKTNFHRCGRCGQPLVRERQICVKCEENKS